MINCLQDYIGKTVVIYPTHSLYIEGTVVDINNHGVLFNPRFWHINKPVEYFYIKHDNWLTRPLCYILMAIRDLFSYEV